MDLTIASPYFGASGFVATGIFPNLTECSIALNYAPVSDLPLINDVFYFSHLETGNHEEAFLTSAKMNFVATIHPHATNRKATASADSRH